MRNFAKFFPVIAMSIFGIVFSSTQIAGAEMYYPDPKDVPPPPVFELPKTSLDQSALSEPAGPSCFDLYHFQSVQVAVGTDKDSYRSGEQVHFSGELKNDNDYPVVDGYVFVRLSRERANFATEGNDVIDEIVPLEKVVLDAKQSKPVAFDWTIPKDLLAGPYRADYFYSVGKKFNLGGLPFSNEVIVGFAKFEIGGKADGGMFFDRTGTRVNGVSYQHIGNWPNVPGGSKVAISQPLKNIGGPEKEAQVRYDLYFWDSLNGADLISSRSEKVVVPAFGSKELIYEIPAVNEPVYYLKITATTGDQRSIVNIRIASDLERPRLNYPAITKFPLAKGDAYTLFSCFHNSSGADTSGKVLLTLSDKDSREIGKMEYAGKIASMMMVDRKDLIADKGYDYLKLSATLIDKNGKTVDSYETIYDCNTIDPAKCAKSYLAYYAAGFVGLIALVILAVISRRKKQLPIALVVLVCVLGGYGMSAPKAEAYNQKTATSHAAAGVYIGDNNDRRLIASSDISLYHYVDMVAGNYTVNTGNPINFSYAMSGAYNATGGNWDTPNICQWAAFSRGQIYWCNSGNPSVAMTSSNPAVISCSGMNCTARAQGTAVLTANIGATPMYVHAQFEWVGRWIGYGTSYGYDGMYLSAPGRDSGSNVMNIAGSSVSWTVTVAGPPTVTLTASPTTVDYYGASTLTWTVADATTCPASGGWSGNKATTGGSESTGSLTVATTYTITCSNSNGSTARSVTVNVNPAQHMTCSNGACAIVTGLASSTCASVADCGSNCIPNCSGVPNGGADGCGGTCPCLTNCGGGGGEHLDCVNNACSWVNGTGYDKCASNSDCGGGGAEHSQCVNKACVIVPGAGTNSCRSNTDCGGVIGPTYGACSNNSCVQVAGTAPPGSFTCGVDADCATGPSYALRSSNNLSIVIVQDNTSYCSNKTTITALPYRGYSSDIKLKVADWGGFAAATSSNFSINTLTIDGYRTGSQFSVCMKPGASPGLYNLKVEGTGGNTVIVKLNLTKKIPTWKETSLWRLLASIRGLF